MTYFGFLGLLVVIPVVLLLVLLWRDRRTGRLLPVQLTNFPAGWVIAVLILIALLYTSPQDNSLVATSVWWYDPDRVTGPALGWVPIEEYTFFILQTLMTGLWVLWLSRKLPLPQREFRSRARLRWGSTLLIGVFWLASAGILIADWQAGAYLGLILIWVLPPVMLQVAFGVDILWHYRRLVLFAILIPTTYLGWADTLAMRAGTWTISPDQTLGIYLPGGLPLEELIFFLMINSLIVSGMILALARASHRRIPAIVRSLLNPLDLQNRES